MSTDPKPACIMKIYAIIRIYGYAGVTHLVVTNLGIKAYGARLPPMFAAQLSQWNNMDCCRFLNNSILIFGSEFFE